jgi:hypothetical protein
VRSCQANDTFSEGIGKAILAMRTGSCLQRTAAARLGNPATKSVRDAIIAAVEK